MSSGSDQKYTHEKKVSNFRFISKFLKDYFKAHFEEHEFDAWKLFFSELTKFFCWSYGESEIISNLWSGSENKVSLWVYLDMGTRSWKKKPHHADSGSSPSCNDSFGFELDWKFKNTGFPRFNFFGAHTLGVFVFQWVLNLVNGFCCKRVRTAFPGVHARRIVLTGILEQVWINFGASANLSRSAL